MATDIGSPQRFFHMPRFQHQAPRQVFYKRPDFAQQQAMQQLTFDGKRMRKAVNRKTIDYNPSVIRHLENRLWQRDHRDFRAVQPDAGCYNDLVPPVGMLNNPMNAVTTKFVRTSTNKVKCPVFVIRWTPEGRRLVTGASSGEFTLWNGLTFNFETILQAHDSPVRAMTWSHNDMWMLTADHGGYVKYWQSNMNNVKMFQAHKEAIREASFSPTDNKFATCSDDGTVRIWDFLRCHEERILRGTRHAHKNTVMEVKWNLNGNWLLTASRDHLCKLFDIRNLKEELQVFRGHKKEATAVAWHPVHEGLFASGGSDGSLLFWHTGVEKEVGGMEMAHEGMIWSLAWHPLGHILCSGSNDHTSKFWTRNRPGDKMRDRYNLNLLPGMSEDGMEYDDVDLNSVASIPGMGIPEQLKAAMEQEQSNKEAAPEVEMSIPGLDWAWTRSWAKTPRRSPRRKSRTPNQFQHSSNRPGRRIKFP
ncbi:pre-mRNA 3' end processing protein WDR33 [Larimichthys crocea]|nr:pre-mRNA 3' end processing protein WDR33 [Larimichthys crocea]